MNPDYWLKQTVDQPLFSDLVWSRPEHRTHAGKLLIIGGNSWGFSAPAQAYTEAVVAGIGSARVLLPAAVHKVVGHVMEHAESAASTPSGSFSQKGLADFLEQAAWADGVLIAGDLGRNSETAILLEKFISKYPGQLTLTKDAVDYAINLAEMVVQRPETCLVLSLGQLQKLIVAARYNQAVTSTMDLVRLVAVLYDFTSTRPIHLVVKHFDNLVVASDGQVSTTKLVAEKPIWRLETAAHTSVWWLQNPAKPFEAMTIGLLNPHPDDAW